MTASALDRMVEQNRSGSYAQIVYAPTGGKLALMSGQSLVKAFVPLPGQATAVYTSSGLDHYRHSDWLGSARLTSSPSRSYVNGLARFSSPDRFSGSAGNPQSLNGYAYALDHPIDLLDPLGLDPCFDPTTGTPLPCPDVTSITVNGSNGNGTYTPGYGIQAIYGAGAGGLSASEVPLIYMGGKGGGGFKALWRDLKNLAHSAVCTATAPLVDMAHSGGGAVGLGLGGSIGAGLMWGLSVQAGVQVVADANGNVGISFTGGGNPGYGVLGVGAIGGVQITNSNANSITGLTGQSFSGGLSLSVAGAAVGVDVSGSKSAQSVTATIGGGVGGKGTGLATTFTAIPSILSTNCGTY